MKPIDPSDYLTIKQAMEALDTNQAINAMFGGYRAPLWSFAR